MNLSQTLKRVVAIGSIAVTASVFGQNPIETRSDTTVLFQSPGIDYRDTDPVVDPQGECGSRLYDAPDALNLGSGRTVGTTLEWIAVQPFVANGDWNVCGLGVDGWYLSGSPTTVNLNIYPDDGSGDTADLNTPLCGNGVDVTMGLPFMVNWVYGDLAERCCLDSGTQYYVAVKPASRDHWSAVYTHTDFSFDPSYSVNLNGDRFTADPLCVRVLGERGCGGLTLEYEGPCPGVVQFTVTNATPGATVGLAYAFARATT